MNYFPVFQLSIDDRRTLLCLEKLELSENDKISTESSFLSNREIIKFQFFQLENQVSRTRRKFYPSSELTFSMICTCSKSLIKLFKDNLRRKMAAHSPATRGCIEPQNKSRATLFPPYIRSYISRRKVSTANSLIPRLIHENV